MEMGVYFENTGKGAAYMMMMKRYLDSEAMATQQDGDFEADDSDGEVAKEAANDEIGPEDEEMQRRRFAEAETVFAEMQKEEAAQVARRVPRTHADPLFLEFQRRHVRPAKDCSLRRVLAELAKYSNSVQADAPQPKSVAELKKQVRAAAQEGGSAPSACGLQPRVRATSVVIEDTVRFAGEAVAVRRRLTPGSAEELRWQQAQKRRKTATLGGTIGSALDAFLLGSAAGSGGGREVSSVEKSGIDWKRHKEESGLENLSSDPHAGALDRRDFLARAAFRSEAAARAAQRAAQRAAAARKGVARKA
ncbi:unnamed protein product [Polarella glacialis]|uniref:BCNT-C domain-containing protein n=1 Tax=Polarella glacialis TaxID=89957 RepID=A0A813GX03_POLGL|nr:unnamed protein product [Polarella glacialis]